MKEYNKFIEQCYINLNEENNELNKLFFEFEGVNYDKDLFYENIDLFQRTKMLPSSTLRNRLIHELIKRKKTTAKEIDLLIDVCNINEELKNLIKDETGLTIEGYATFYKSNLTPTDKQIINEITAEIEQKVQESEEKVSSIMNSLQDEFVKLVGFEKRFKATDRIALSLIKIINEFPNITIEEAILSICDALRYTLVIDEEVYQQKVLEKSQVLKNLGYELTHLKNAWGTPMYQGINIGFKNKTDIEFEVQFHTENSYMVKEKINHMYYEITRNNTTSPEARFKAAEIMKKTQLLFVDTIENALCFNISYVNNSMIKYRNYTDSEIFKKQYQEEYNVWKNNNPEANRFIEKYVTEDIRNIGCYCTINAILRGIFKQKNMINVLRVDSSKYDIYQIEEFEKIVNKSVEEYEQESLTVAKTINDSISNMELKEDTIMYRGINENALSKYDINLEYDKAETIYKKLISKGNFYVENGFMSATPILDDVINSKKIILVMNCKEKTKGICLNFINKAEFLFPVNSKFHIDMVTKENNKIYIHISSI